MNGVKNYQQWKKFSARRETVSVYITPEQIYYMSPSDKEKTSEQKVRELFKEKGIEITRYRHQYDKSQDTDYWGLVFHRSDSDVIERMEITAIVGVNARRVDEG